jgi:negative regulator of sigma-B (phosphoserine phosphatase)
MNLLTSHISIPKPGERANGDAVLVRRDALGNSLLAVIDGLGHGPGAAEASRAAVDHLQEAQLSSPLEQLMRSLHGALKGTRGAVGTVCVIDGQRLRACAVGNVQLMCANCSVPLVLSAGVLGHSVAKFRIGECMVRVGARLALISDGVSTRFRLEELRGLAPEEACKTIMDRHRRHDDDATVLIADLTS